MAMVEHTEWIFLEFLQWNRKLSDLHYVLFFLVIDSDRAFAMGGMGEMVLGLFFFWGWGGGGGIGD